MVGISLSEAWEIASLLGLRVPTLLEWQRAGSYTDGRNYPFGNKFDKSKANLEDKGTRSVFAHRDGKSPEGVLDLIGNVFEWTDTPLGKFDLSDPKNPVFIAQKDVIYHNFHYIGESYEKGPHNWDYSKEVTVWRDCYSAGCTHTSNNLGFRLAGDLRKIANKQG